MILRPALIDTSRHHPRRSYRRAAGSTSTVRERQQEHCLALARALGISYEELRARGEADRRRRMALEAGAA